MPDEQRPDLECRAAGELWSYLRQVPVGSELDMGSGSTLCSVLELLIPHMLRRAYPEWQGESLDGFAFASSTKTADSTATLAGTCILMSDQSAAPCLLTFELADSQSFRASRIRLGETGGGPLGVSGPAGSSNAWKLLANLNGRLDHVQWVYDLTDPND